MGEESIDHAYWSPELWASVRASALEAGFHLAGIAAAKPEPETDSPEAARFTAWVDAGRAGEMDYLKRRDDAGRLLRENVRIAFPWARSIVVCAFNYDSDLPISIDPAARDQGWIGRYAWSGRSQPEKGYEAALSAPMMATDYHDTLLDRLGKVEAKLRDAAKCRTLNTKCYVDTGPLVERGFAAKAGVGWIGKNTCVINQELGSWLLLGVIVTSLAIYGEHFDGESAVRNFDISVAADRCGSCTRCLDACPTDALVAPREMDASRCIAYLTIEKKGATAPEFREAMGRQVFGCDICQDVCPWNRRHRNGGNRRAAGAVNPGIDNLGLSQGPEQDMRPRPELVNPPLDWLAAMDAKEFKQWFKGSPLERTGRKRLHRNVAIAMGNSGKREFLVKLQAWAEGEDAVLAEAARWAIGRIYSLAETFV